jgi:DNA replication ATP-dependent helicase Dna2
MSNNDDKGDADEILADEEMQNPEFLVEGLSQDIIEWDESNNIDLRTLYPSPFAVGIRARTTTTDDSNISQKSSNVRIKKMNQQLDPSHYNDSTRINLDRTFQNVSLQKEIEIHEQRRKDRLAGAEKEIDGIFNILQMEETIHRASRTTSSSNSNNNNNDRILKRRNSSPSDVTTQGHNKKRPPLLGDLQRCRSHPPLYQSSHHPAVALRQRLRQRMQQKRKGRSHRIHSHSMPSTHNIIHNTATDHTSLDQPNKCLPTNHKSTSTLTTSPNRDGFSELLDDLKTPRNSVKTQPSREPLTNIDGNAPKTETTDDDSIGNKLPISSNYQPPPVDNNTQSSRVSMSPQPISIMGKKTTPLATGQLPSVKEYKNNALVVQNSMPTFLSGPSLNEGQAKSLALTHHQNQTDGQKRDLKQRSPRSMMDNTNDKKDDDEDDEFDNVSFTVDELAIIDSLSGASISKDSHTETLPPCAFIKLDNNVTTKNTHIIVTNVPSETRKQNDTVQDHKDFLDISKIDVLVAEKTLFQNNLTSATTTTSKARSDQDADLSSKKATSVLTKCCKDSITVVGRNDPVFDEDDEYGEFPKDLDFGRIDALIASQANDSIGDSKQNRTTTTTTTQTQRQIEAIAQKEDVDDEADEFDTFPFDIDFDRIDAIVAERYSQSMNRSNDGINTTCNSRINPTSICKEQGLSYTRYTRYKVVGVTEHVQSYQKSVWVTSWTHSMSKACHDEKKIHRMSSPSKIPNFRQQGDDLVQDLKALEDGCLILAGEWYHTPIQVGDVVNLCSLFGRCSTDKAALPITLHTYSPPGSSDVDDLVLVLHPDMMMTPSTISEASYCNRRAVLKSKLGSTGLTSKAALVGTMIHALFGECLSGKRFDKPFVQQIVKRMMQEKAEMLIGCMCSESDIENDVLNAVPTIQRFAAQYTSLLHDSAGDFVGGIACHPDIHLLAQGVHSVEESIVSPELGLKGDVDVILTAQTRQAGERKNFAPTNCTYHQDTNTSRNLMCLELKTGHNQTAQRAHLAQLSLYTFLLQSRYGIQPRQDQSRQGSCGDYRDNGAAASGILLYLNEKAKEIYHVSPEMNEMKTLLNQRNVVASELRRASRPRGISLSYQDGTREEGGQGVKLDIQEAPPAQLPELMDHVHTCKRCFSNRECMLYAASGSMIRDNQSHSELMFQFTGHLNAQDLKYFRDWDRLIDIEEDAVTTSLTTSWLIDAKSREESRDSISGLFLDRSASLVDESQLTATVCFRRKSGQNAVSSLEALGFSPGNSVVVSTDSTLENGLTEVSQESKNRHRMHLVRGFVDYVGGDTVVVSCKSREFYQVKELADRHHQTSETELLFRMDKNHSSIGTGILRWNLINFLSGDAVAPNNDRNPTRAEIAKKTRLPRLRDVIVRLKAPTFIDGILPPLFEGIDRNIPGCSFHELSREFSCLNAAQQNAVRKTMSAFDYTLIQGLPGTGKSSTLSFLARLLVAKGKRVLITAYTHSAVDNIMLKLMEKGMGEVDSLPGKATLVRVGQTKSCHKDVRRLVYTEISRSSETSGGVSVSSLRETLSGARIVGVSTLSLPRSQVLQNEHFDVVIVDEAGQMNQPATLGALMAADLFVLVGDHKQLPPLVNSEVAEAGGYGESLMSRLAEKHPSAIAPLTLQYRMNEEICRVSSEAFYGGRMRCGNEKVGSRCLSLPGYSVYPTEQHFWTKRVIDPKAPVVLVDTDKIKSLQNSDLNSSGVLQAHSVEFEPLEEKLGDRVCGSIVNRTEAKIVQTVIEAFIDCGLDAASIGVISPFRAQIRILEESEQLSSLMARGLELSTIDKYQGRDKDVIILSMVRSNQKGNTGRLLQDARRLNVALTRAKCKLVVVGSVETLCRGSPPLKPILNRMKRRNQIVHLP